MRPVPVLWHEMLVKNIGPQYVDRLNIRSQHSHVKWQVIVHRLTTTLTCSHSLNTFEVSSYQNWTVQVMPQLSACLFLLTYRFTWVLGPDLETLDTAVLLTWGVLYE